MSSELFNYPYGNVSRADAEAISPGVHYGKPRDLTQHLPTLQHEAFLAWLSATYPKRRLRIRLGHPIPTRTLQEWHAEWMALPPDDTFTQLWRSLNRESRDKLYAEADALGRKVYDELNAAFPLEE